MLPVFAIVLLTLFLVTDPNQTQTPSAIANLNWNALEFLLIITN